MVIRMKVKHLVAASVILLVTLFIIINFGGYIFYQYALLLDRMGFTEKANVYYSRISNNYSNNGCGILAEYKRLQNIIKEGNFRYSGTFSVISGGFISTSGYIGYKTVDDVNAKYEILKTNNAADRNLMAEYTMATALVNWFGGRTDRAAALLEALEPEDERLQAFKNLHLANMYFYLGETEKSLQIIADMKSPAGLEGYQEDIIILNRLFAGDGEIAYEYPMIYQYDPHFSCLEEPLKFTRSMIEPLQSFTTKAETGTGGNRLTGQITMDGKPQRNMMVFVKDAEYKNIYASTFGSGDGLIGLGISDEEGHYEITGIPNGVYGFILYIPWQRITGKNISFHSDFDLVLKGNTEKVENIALSYPIRVNTEETDDSILFQWSEDQLPEDSCLLTLSELEETDGVLYRTNNSYYIQQKKGNGLNIKIKEAQKTAYRLGFSYGSKPDPKEYIEPLYHSGQYGYTLYGFQGNNMIHFTNEGMYSNHPPAQVTIRGSEWTREDRLLLEEKFEEARAAYEALLEQDPENIHALKVLSRMYDMGYIAPEGDQSIVNLGGRNEERALQLLQRLERLAGGKDIKSALADQYQELKQYDKAIELLAIVQNENPNPFTELEIGRIHLYMNRFAESVEYFQKYTQMTGSGTINLFLPAILMNNEDLLKESAGAYKTTIHTDIHDLVDAYIGMQKLDYQVFFEMVAQNRTEEAENWLDGRNDELGGFLKAVFLLTRDTNEISYEEKDNTFRQYHQQVQNPVLDELMLYLGRELINSGYGSPLDNPDTAE